MTTQAQKDFLINRTIDQMTVFLMEDYGLELPAALELVYNSQLYEKIINLETGLYYQSAAYNYDLLKQEIAYGKNRLMALEELTCGTPTDWKSVGVPQVTK